MKQTLKLAFRNLFRNTRRTFLTTLLTGLSLSALMLTDGLMLGMAQTMINAATNIWSGEIQVHQQGFLEKMDVDLYMKDPQKSIATLENHKEVLAYSERVISGGMLSSSQNMSAALIYGVEAEKELKLSKIGDAIVKGGMLDPQQRNNIMIGKEMASLLEVGLGDRLVLTVSQAETGELSQELFRLSGVFEFGIRELDESIVLINISRARELLAIGEGSHEIAVRLTDPVMARDQNSLILKELNTENIKAESWVSFSHEIASIIELSSFSIWILAVILFALVALGVLNSVFMSIHERIYEFGVIRAIGTSAGQLFTTVMCEAFILGIFSVILGCVIGGLLNYILSITGLYMGTMEFSGISFNEPIKTVVQVHQFIEYPIWVMIITLLSSLYPAIYAARLLPAEALHRAL